jgi:phage repressor protein C with HTH and peptisase S24 domain
MENRSERNKPDSCMVREIAFEGEVGAGRLVPFEPRGGTVSMLVPDHIPEGEPLGAMRVNGRSLEGVGIHDGDFVLVRKLFSRKQVKKDTVCVLWLHTLGEVVAKKVTFRKDHLILHYCGLEPEPPLILPASDVEFRGIVIGVSRQQTEWPEIARSSPRSVAAANGNGEPALSRAEREKRITEAIRHLKPVPSRKDVPR